jgi:hypothetical protein
LAYACWAISKAQSGTYKRYTYSQKITIAGLKKTFDNLLSYLYDRGQWKSLWTLPEKKLWLETSEFEELEGKDFS